MTTPPARDPEELLAQALRAMAGGGRQSPRPTVNPPAGAPFSVLQIVLLAIFLGLLVGMTAGVISLLS